jgi:hypothetical protein
MFFTKEKLDSNFTKLHKSKSSNLLQNYCFWYNWFYSLGSFQLLARWILLSLIDPFFNNLKEIATWYPICVINFSAFLSRFFILFTTNVHNINNHRFAPLFVRLMLSQLWLVLILSSFLWLAVILLPQLLLAITMLSQIRLAIRILSELQLADVISVASGWWMRALLWLVDS